MIKTNSKLIKRPQFKSLPQSNAANVPENIDNWISRGKWNMVETFCRPRGSSYRFVNTEDLTEIKCVQQKILGKDCDLIFSRFVHTTDSFCPLWFTEWFLRIEVVCEGRRHEYKNDNQLKTFLKSL